MAAPLRPARSSPARCRITTGRSCSARGRSARDRSRPSSRSPPSGRSIQAKGIDPDIVVEAAKIEKTNEKGEKVTTASDLKKDDSDEGGAEQASVDPSIIGTPADYQLTRAVDMLRGIALF